MGLSLFFTSQDRQTQGPRSENSGSTVDIKRQIETKKTLLFKEKNEFNYFDPKNDHVYYTVK